MNNLQVGTIYQSTTHGMVEYLGTDRYWGELTFHFRSHTYRQETYIKPEELEKFIVQQETIESLRRDRDDLLAAQQDHQRLVRQLDVLLNGEDGAAQQASLCDLVSQLDKLGRDDYGNKVSKALSALKISIPTDAMEQEINSQVRMATAKLKTRNDTLLAALHGVADTLDKLSQEQSISSLQGGAIGAATGIRLSIIKILGVNHE